MFLRSGSVWFFTEKVFKLGRSAQVLGYLRDVSDRSHRFMYPSFSYLEGDSYDFTFCLTKLSKVMEGKKDYGHISFLGRFLSL